MARELFVVGGFDKFRAVSADGLVWEHATFSEKQSTVGSSLAFGDGRCALLVKRGYYGKAYLDFTRDGETWDSHEIKTGQLGHAVAFFKGRFLVCLGDTIGSGHKPKIVTTDDGSSWSKEHAVGGRSIMTRYAEGNDRLVGVGPSGMAATTTDGETWKVADLKTAESMISLAYGKGRFVGGGLHGTIWRSEDGLAWELVNTGDEGEHVNSMIWDGERFVGVGLGATYLSDDGANWERIKNHNAPLAAVRGRNGRYVGCQWKGRLLVSDDGVRWKDQETLDRHFETVGVGIVGN